MTQHNDGDKKWLKTNPVVTDTAILVPTQQYCQEGTSVTYREVITKEVFIEAYKMWILPHLVCRVGE